MNWLISMLSGHPSVAQSVEWRTVAGTISMPWSSRETLPAEQNLAPKNVSIGLLGKDLVSL